MANQEFTAAQNIRRAPSSRTADARVANQEFTVAQNIRCAPSSRAITSYISATNLPQFQSLLMLFSSN